MSERRPPDAPAVLVMLVLTLLWGLQQVAVKLALPGMSPATQGALRSLIAALLVLAWSRWRGLDLWQRDRSAVPGLLAGLLFAAEFLLIYRGLNLTSASRLVVLVYLAPVLTAVGLSRWVPGERLAASQWAGVALAFAGVVLAFAENAWAARGPDGWIGDLFALGAALLWAATTVLIRRTALAAVPAEKTLLYQLAVSAPVMAGAAWVLGEPGLIRWDATLAASLVFQSVVVAFASYLAWFWLLTRYLAGRLVVFSFLTPLFGVLFGVWVLGERLTALFGAAALLVAAGIVLVTARRG